MLHAALLPPSSTRVPGLPPDLAAWWQVFGGVDRAALGDDSPLLPLYWHPLDVETALRSHDTGRVPIAADCYEEDELLFVDLHDGHVFSDDAAEWPSVTAMLDHVLRIFEHGNDPAYRLLRYTDGHINWE
ncbi:hypothetical protein [Lentzea californiensis]|uniref:hypothetical protein n=1 Tax=Lentzea californiensis TaxID=438851 RepID=UPI00216675CA|nr:hypothetical protein [Lentzea californiensis]MCR3753896.1 hypothetical protein [Lentzea californiensis]